MPRLRERLAHLREHPAPDRFRLRLRRLLPGALLLLGLLLLALPGPVPEPRFLVEVELGPHVVQEALLRVGRHQLVPAGQVDSVARHEAVRVRRVGGGGSPLSPELLRLPVRRLFRVLVPVFVLVVVLPVRVLLLPVGALRRRCPGPPVASLVEPARPAPRAGFVVLRPGHDAPPYLVEQALRRGREALPADVFPGVLRRSARAFSAALHSSASSGSVAAGGLRAQ